MPRIPWNLLDEHTARQFAGDLGLGAVATTTSHAELLQLLQDVETDGRESCPSPDSGLLAPAGT